LTAVARRALLLAPSRGLGGGIERYVETLEWAFGAKDVQCQRIDLERPGMSGHARLAARGRSHVRADAARVRLVVAHRSLLPAAVLLAQDDRVAGISVVCHGNDVWGTGRPIRRAVENRLMRRPDVRMVAVSSYTAGALGGSGTASVLSPGLSSNWFDVLVRASAAGQSPGRETAMRIVTAFRLSQWRDKGLPEIMQAVRSLRCPDIRVTVCGSGAVPVELEKFVRSQPACTLRPSLADHELARELATADLFVLATRTRRGRHPSGEGFGLVLLESQVAGTPVVGPAYAGSHDAYVDAVTGVTPADETAESLANTLGELIRDRWQLEQMGKQAAEWSRACFAPELYASRVAARLL
jgi:glycosyltransferase involved in cell wall biosynthesis